MDQSSAAPIDNTVLQSTYISFYGISKGGTFFGIIMATARSSKHATGWELFTL